jgi:hypothetical protein
MNVCKELHEDYFNDSTVYINFEEKQFAIRCNRIPCNRKMGMATHDLEHLNFLFSDNLIQRAIVACCYVHQMGMAAHGLVHLNFLYSNNLIQRIIVAC